MSSAKYDYLIVGAGLFGATFAAIATEQGKKCLVIDSRKHIAGNAYTEEKEGIHIHKYGPHIFHTNNDRIWEFVNRYTSFNNFILSPKAYRDGRMYSLPFNMNTFYEVWGCVQPEQAKEIIEAQRFRGDPTNLEEQALSLVGRDIYELLIRSYTAKQWMKDPRELPAFIIKRLPLRFTYDNNYFDDKYQGIPVDGYTAMVQRMLKDCVVKLNEDYFKNKEMWDAQAKKVVYTGKIDEYFDYKHGDLEYRSLDFNTVYKEDISNFQGCAQINYTSPNVPWTRIIEHKHFTGAKTDGTFITTETPTAWSRNKIPYYPVNDMMNTYRYEKYAAEAETLQNVIFGGRLAEFKYMDMHQVIASAMKIAEKELQNAKP